MDEINVLSVLNEIAADAGKLHKENVIKRNASSEVFKQVLLLTYNPNIIWYVSKLPDRLSQLTSDESTWSLGRALDVMVKLIASRQVTGNRAIECMIDIASHLSIDDYEVLKRVVAKDLGVGINASTINKAIKKLVPVTPYMGAIVFEDKAVRKLCTGTTEVDVKMDGRYCNIVVLPSGEVDMVSRQGKSSLIDHPTLKARAVEISDAIFPDGSDTAVLNGELMLAGYDRYTANGMIASLVSLYEKIVEQTITQEEIEKKRNEFVKSNGITMDEAIASIYITIWDYIPYSLYINAEPYMVWRSTRLNNLMLAGLTMTDGVIRIIEHQIVATYEEVMAYFNELLLRGEEGAIVKSMTGPWTNGKPTTQVKLKLKIEVDLRIIGFKEGNGKNAGTLGSLHCESSDGVLKVTPTWCDNKVRDHIWKNQEEFIGRVVEVSCNGISKDMNGNYSLMHPVATIIRDDKDVADDINQINKINKMALGLQ